MSSSFFIEGDLMRRARHTWSGTTDRRDRTSMGRCGGAMDAYFAHHSEFDLPFDSAPNAAHNADCSGAAGIAANRQAAA